MPKIVLVHQTGPKKGEKEVFSTAKYKSLFMGRSADCDVKVDDPNCVVSRTHALLEWDDEGETPTMTVTDLHSANGTFVNGDRVEEPVSVANGDAIQLGVKVGPVLRVALIRPADEADESAGGVEEVRTAFPDIRDESREEERARKPAAGTRHLIRSDD
ncbi:MAG: FHA domain-containing protein [Pseudomonadota bacterium]